MDPSPVDERLPGADLVGQGLADLAEGSLTVEALLVAAAVPLLRALGLEVAPVAVEAPLHRLYAMLAAADARNAHSRNNALIGHVVSFARAAEHAAGG